MGFSYSNKLFGGTGSGGLSPSGTLVADRVAIAASASTIKTDDLAYNGTTDSLSMPSSGSLMFSTDAGIARSSAAVIKAIGTGGTVGGFTASTITAAALTAPTPTVTPTLTKIGSITVVAGADLVDGDFFTVDDGGSYVYEFDNDATVTPGRIAIPFTGAETADQIRDLVFPIINANNFLSTAAANGAATISLTMNAAGAVGGTCTENVAAPAFAISGFSNPTAATAYSYKVVATTAGGQTTDASAAGSTAAGHATLSASNYNYLTWGAVTGAAGYTIYRTVGGATQGIIGTTTTAVNLTDNGLAGGGETAPTSNGTGVVTGARVAAGDGTLSAPGFAFAAQSGTGFLRSGSSQVDLALNESLRHRWTATGYSISAATGTIGISSDLILSRPAAATLQLGAAAANADGFDQTIQTQGGITGTDRAAGDLTIQTGVGTGTGASSIIFKAPTPQATGTTAQTHATVLTLKDAGTGGTSAPQALFADGTVTAPSISVSTYPQTGFYVAAANGIGFSRLGVAGVHFNSFGMKLPAARAIQWTADTTNTAAADLILSRGAAATLQLGDAASATPVAQTLQAQGGSGTDIAGASLTIQSGAGTGAGAGSTLFFKAPTATTTGTTTQTQTTLIDASTTNGIRLYSTLQTGPIRADTTDTRAVGSATVLYTTGYFSRATLGSKSKQITDGSATTFATFTIADGATYSGEIIYNVKAREGTSLQVLAGRARFVATREGATYTVSVAEVGTQLLAAAAGTLTGAIEISGAAGVITLAANFNTSLTPAAAADFTINSRFDSPDAGLTLTFPTP